MYTRTIEGKYTSWDLFSTEDEARQSADIEAHRRFANHLFVFRTGSEYGGIALHEPHYASSFIPEGYIIAYAKRGSGEKLEWEERGRFSQRQRDILESLGFQSEVIEKLVAPDDNQA